MHATRDIFAIIVVVALIVLAIPNLKNFMVGTKKPIFRTLKDAASVLISYLFVIITLGILLFFVYLKLNFPPYMAI